MRRLLSLPFLLFLLFGTLAFLILTLFLLFLSSLCKHDEGKKKKGKRSCWQRSASPARGPRCLGLVHHGRQSHLQIRRETLKECKWERKRERLREKKDREEERKVRACVCVCGGALLSNACTNTHTPVFGYEDKKNLIFIFLPLLTCVNLF